MRIKILKRKCINFWKTTSVGITALVVSIISTMPVYADDLKDSQIVKGTEKLIGDITTWLMVLSPIVSGLLIIYFFIRRSASDEMDQKKWNNRVVVAIVSCVGAVLGSATLNLVIGYYK